MRKLTVSDGDRELELEPDTTTVVLFKGNDDLDHVQVYLASEGLNAFIYDPGLIRKLLDEGYPIYYRVDRPQWAIERRMLRVDVTELDRLFS